MVLSSKKLPPLYFSNAVEEEQFCQMAEALDPRFKPHVLSSGAGVDSNALLIHYCEMSEEERGFPLCNLVVIHAVVGGESVKTRRIMEEAIFPLCREHNIWFIQAHRNGQFERQGITVLSSTRQPQRFYVRGSYSLLFELLTAGTVPQRNGNKRLCTLKFKGWIIDAIAMALFRDSPRERFIGYNADEAKRAAKDHSITSQTPIYEVGFNADEVSRLKEKNFGDQPYDYEIGFNADESGRIKESGDRKQVFRFPLIEMGLGRQWCEDRLSEFLLIRTQGRITQGEKSYCLNCCPFPECNGKKRLKGNSTHADLREDWRLEPHYGGEAAFIEHVALGLNVNQPLFTKQLVVEVLRESGNTEALAYYQALLDGEHWPEPVAHRLREVATDSTRQQAGRILSGKTWAVYSVRRIFDGKAKVPFRQTRILHQGSQASSLEFLNVLSDRYGKESVLEKLSWRLWSIPRPETVVTYVEGKRGKPKRVVTKPKPPFVEEQFVVMPATPYEKQRISNEAYDLKWASINGTIPTVLGETNHDQSSSYPITRSNRKAKRRVAAN